MRGAITGYIDVAQLVLYAFWIFFFGLVFYLRREDRREGYPLESEAMGRAKSTGFLLIPTPKIFRVSADVSVAAPTLARETRELSARKTEPWPGAPLTPVGDPMLAGVGPGSYAMRADVPDQTHEGVDRIVPLRLAPNFKIAKEDASPIGMRVTGADGVVAGTVKEAWVDRGEALLRYYEVALTGGGRSVMLPVNFCVVKAGPRNIKVTAILGGQFSGVPATRSPDRVTRLEEERIVAYYGAGTLYATPERLEPIL